MTTDLDRMAADMLGRPEARRALDALRRSDARTLTEQRRLTEVPAPPFHEAARAALMADLMRDARLEHVGADDEGNVAGRWAPPGAGDRVPFFVAAHLDTVFPAGTDVRVRSRGGVLRAPGIADNGRGLAALLALSRALGSGALRPGRPVWMVATVGEEGPGNLRGARHLFRPGGAAATDGCAAFLALDGAGTRGVVHRGVGSVRHRLTVDGPGGHSWSDWGRPNPIAAIAGASTALTRLADPGARRGSGPRVTVNLGRVGGGTSVNAIPEAAWLEFEVRSDDPGSLARTARAARRAIEQAVGPEKGLRWRMESLGERPAGFTAADTPLIQAALAATRATGFEPELTASSTDANVPMSHGVPALTIGAGGVAGGMHTLGEWYRNTHGPTGIARALLTLMVADRLLP